eukprot:PhF_6_TR16958/c0_g1_i1/m.25585
MFSMVQIFCAVLLGADVFIISASTIPPSSTHYYAFYNYEQSQWSISTSPSNSKSIPHSLSIQYSDKLNTTGWSWLRVVATTSQQQHENNIYHRLPTHQVYFGAGYAEGKLTAGHIYQTAVNNRILMSNNSPPAVVMDWLDNHTAWIERSATTAKDTDPFWNQVYNVLQQLHGMMAGYNEQALTLGYPSMTFLEFFRLNFVFEKHDLYTALGVTMPHDLIRPHKSQDHCTAIVRITQDDLYVAHNTWAGYNQMIRTYKEYELVPGRRIAFSGYPGFLHSGDDWYMLSNGLVVQETTNAVLDPRIYRYIQYQSVSEWIRVMVANMVVLETPGTGDGFAWVTTFCRYNSGTYNNQYMVVNMNLYTKGEQHQLPDGLLWIAEQMPGMCPYMDVTKTLQAQGYWASFNRPYLPEVYVESGTYSMYQKYGDYYSYTKYARPMIFARNATNIQSLDDLQRFMRYNNWQKDVLSKCPGCTPYVTNPKLSIAERGDLVPILNTTRGDSWGVWAPFLHGPVAVGAIDAKITSKSLMSSSLVGVIVSGPTWDQQPPFQWSTSPVNNDVPHIGQVDLQAFAWYFTNDTSVWN